jgi:hypothetical protein
MSRRPYRSLGAGFPESSQPLKGIWTMAAIFAVAHDTTYGGRSGDVLAIQQSRQSPWFAVISNDYVVCRVGAFASPLLEHEWLRNAYAV